MIVPAIYAFVGAAVTGMWIDGKRTPGTPRDWRKQIPTLILIGMGLLFLGLAAAGF